MSSLAVVPDLDELKEVVPRLHSRIEGMVVEQLLRERREEALDDRIVPTVTNTTHAWGEACLSQERLIRPTRVLDAAIRVMEAAAGTPMEQRYSKRGGGEFLIQPRTQGPSHHPARCQIEPALAGRDVGDVRGPRLIRTRMPLHRELAIKHIRNNGLGMTGLRGHPKLPPWPGLDAGLPHEATHARLPTSKAQRAQLHADPRRAIALLHLPLNLADPRREHVICLHAFTERPIAPRIVAGLRHLQHSAHRRDVPNAGVRLDERESHRASLAKKAVAFFRISRSSRRRSFSARRRRFSSSRVGTLGVPRACAVSCCPHCRRTPALMPKSRAICLTGLPLSTSRTASRRNSSLYFRGLPMNHLLPRKLLEAVEVSTKPGQVQQTD